MGLGPLLSQVSSHCPHRTLRRLALVPPPTPCQGLGTTHCRLRLPPPPHSLRLTASAQALGRTAATAAGPLLSLASRPPPGAGGTGAFTDDAAQPTLT